MYINYIFRIVRASAIPALGKLISDSNSREAGDKARMTLETIARELQDSPSALVVPLVLTLASITSSSSQNYVEDGWLPYFQIKCFNNNLS